MEGANDHISNISIILSKHSWHNIILLGGNSLFPFSAKELSLWKFICLQKITAWLEYEMLFVLAYCSFLSFPMVRNQQLTVSAIYFLTAQGFVKCTCISSSRVHSFIIQRKPNFLFFWFASTIISTTPVDALSSLIFWKISNSIQMLVNCSHKLSSICVYFVFSLLY